MGVHGMMVFSDGKQLFASHLPLLHPPHDYQIVLQLQADNAELQDELVSAARHNVLTLEPERFDLLKLKPPAQLQTFSAAVYDGHFERHGRKRTNAQFTVKTVLLFEHIVKQPVRYHRYIVIPHAQGSFLVHKITSKGDFDQILDTTQTGLPAVIEQRTPLTLPSIDARLPIARIVWWETQDLVD